MLPLKHDIVVYTQNLKIQIIQAMPYGQPQLD